MKKTAIIATIAFLLGTSFGVWMVDDIFSDREYTLTWHDDGAGRCLYWMYPTKYGNGGSYLTTLFV